MMQWITYQVLGGMTLLHSMWDLTWIMIHGFEAKYDFPSFWSDYVKSRDI